MAQLAPMTHVLNDGSACIVRSACEDDAEAMIEHNDRLRHSSEHMVSQPHEPLPTLAKQERQIAKADRSPNHLILVAEPLPDANRIVAAIEFHGHRQERLAHHGTFGIGVDEEHRGTGLGRLLIVSLLNWALDHDKLEKISLGVMETNERARKLYSSLGFVEECREQRFFKVAPGEYVDDISMSIYTRDGVAPEGFQTWRRVNVESGPQATKNGS